MRTHRTILAAFTALLLSAAPLWARGGGGFGGGGGFSVGGGRGGGGGSTGGVFGGSSGGSLTRGGGDSKGSDGASSKGSGGGGSSKGSSGNGGGRSNKGSGNNSKSDRSDRPDRNDRTDGGKDRAGKDGDRKPWGRGDDRLGRGGRGGGNVGYRPPCPRGHRDCHRNCCNRFGFGYPGWGYGGFGNLGWGYGGFGYGWYDSYDPGTDSRRDDDRDRRGYGQGNVELRLSPKDVEVYVNGILYSTKGNAKISLPTGTWRLEIRAEGYLTETIELDIEQGVKYKIERKLMRDPDYRVPSREERRSDA